MSSEIDTETVMFIMHSSGFHLDVFTLDKYLCESKKYDLGFDNFHSFIIQKQKTLDSLQNVSTVSTVLDTIIFPYSSFLYPIVSSSCEFLFMFLIELNLFDVVDFRITTRLIVQSGLHYQ